MGPERVIKRVFTELTGSEITVLLNKVNKVR